MEQERFRIFRPGSTDTGEAELVYRQGVWAAVSCMCKEPNPPHFFVLHVPTGRPCSEVLLTSDDAIKGVRAFGQWPDVGKDLAFGEEVPPPTDEQTEWLRELNASMQQPPQISVVMVGMSNLPPELTQLINRITGNKEEPASQPADKSKMN